MSLKQNRKARLELEALEGRDAPSALAAGSALVTAQPAHQAGTISSAPTVSAMSQVTAGYTVSLSVTHGGIRVNHNQTLLRVRRRKGRCR
jgi:hypothetical protein